MKKIISNCFDLGERLYDGEQLLQPVREYGDYLDLDNGVTLCSLNDGRYINDADDLDHYAAVYEWDDEAEQGDLIGFVQL